MVETDRLRLRPVVSGDADAVWRIHSDPRTNQHNPAGPMTDSTQAVELARSWAASWAEDGHGYWAVEERREPGTVIGFGGLRLVEWRGRQVYNLYYRLTPEAWGRGIASELVGAAVNWWRDSGEQYPLVAYTTADNVASQRTAARGGLTRRPDLDEETAEYTDVVFALGLD
ncbi:GNAT family N-acetyltransferase [Sanguibacter suaedae]|uniref:GNAT family N-acetyltransferase n=1 Tax=Sanguibacter suaedae TaxID=2795737 RepID=A0A934I964_9MICO|nr:GNAT family N-acetyltransferase [Sanguibacter suaedae]MBI9113691.1 GNAT family N-acetyltransferase [Sanguibacter suaedae]